MVPSAEIILVVLLVAVVLVMWVPHHFQTRAKRRMERIAQIRRRKEAEEALRKRHGYTPDESAEELARRIISEKELNIINAPLPQIVTLVNEALSEGVSRGKRENSKELARLNELCTEIQETSDIFSKGCQHYSNIIHKIVELVAEHKLSPEGTPFDQDLLDLLQSELSNFTHRMSDARYRLNKKFHPEKVDESATASQQGS